MSQPAVRLGDLASTPACSHNTPACPRPASGPAVACSPNVLVNGRGAVRVGDAGIQAVCMGSNEFRATRGSATVFANGRPVCRVGDATQHCGGSGTFVSGSSDTMVG